MRSTTWTAVVASGLVLFAVGCRGGLPVYNVENAPVATAKTNPSLNEIGKTIVRAGASLGWQMRETRPGQIVGTLNLRRHTAIVDVRYNTQSYSITYKDSTELQYDGKNIHPNYNGWVQNLDNRIRAQLSAL